MACGRAAGWACFWVLRCGPWGTHGIDRVPEHLTKQFRWFTPWRYWLVSKRMPG